MGALCSTGRYFCEAFRGVVVFVPGCWRRGMNNLGCFGRRNVADFYSRSWSALGKLVPFGSGGGQSLTVLFSLEVLP